MTGVSLKWVGSNVAETGGTVGSSSQWGAERDGGLRSGDGGGVWSRMKETVAVLGELRASK